MEKIQVRFRNKTIPCFVACVLPYDAKLYETYGPVGEYLSVDSLKRAIRILYRYSWLNGDNPQSLDLCIMKNAQGDGYRLLAYNRNWVGVSAYYAGIIDGWNMRQKKHER